MRRATTVGKHAENGKALFRARRAKGLSQMRVCEIAGVSHRQYVRLENGEHLPSGALRDRLAEVLGVDRDALKSGDDEAEEPLLPPDLVAALQVLARYAGTTTPAAAVI